MTPAPVRARSETLTDVWSSVIEYLRAGAGLSLEELLDGLREQRARYHAERLERP